MFPSCPYPTPPPSAEISQARGSSSVYPALIGDASAAKGVRVELGVPVKEGRSASCSIRQDSEDEPVLESRPREAVVSGVARAANDEMLAVVEVGGVAGVEGADVRGGRRERSALVRRRV